MLQFLNNFLAGFGYGAGGATSASLVWAARNKIKKEWESHKAQQEIAKAKAILAANGENTEKQ